MPSHQTLSHLWHHNTRKKWSVGRRRYSSRQCIDLSHKQKPSLLYHSISLFLTLLCLWLWLPLCCLVTYYWNSSFHSHYCAYPLIWRTIPKTPQWWSNPVTHRWHVLQWCERTSAPFGRHTRHLNPHQTSMQDTFAWCAPDAVAVILMLFIPTLNVMIQRLFNPASHPFHDFQR